MVRNFGLATVADVKNGLILETGNKSAFQSEFPSVCDIAALPPFQCGKPMAFRCAANNTSRRGSASPRVIRKDRAWPERPSLSALCGGKAAILPLLTLV